MIKNKTTKSTKELLEIIRKRNKSLENAVLLEVVEHKRSLSFDIEYKDKEPTWFKHYFNEKYNDCFYKEFSWIL